MGVMRKILLIFTTLMMTPAMVYAYIYSNAITDSYFTNQSTVSLYLRIYISKSLNCLLQKFRRENQQQRIQTNNQSLKTVP
jgi:hypothetical protein